METRELFNTVTETKQPFKWVKDLTASGRILIAGCSGSGKSVALKDIIYTLMARDPDKNQFVFVDLKRVELKVFKTAPHTLAYVTEPEHVEEALNRVLMLIDARYRKMEAEDKLVSDAAAVWVVIDEYADLVTIGSKAIEKAVQRIAQIGRASRVNLILCTQRPTKDILNGKISCNLDSRLALRCVCSQDSRNILSVSGAEELPDYGKAIMQIKGRNSTIEIPFLDQEELKARVAAWKGTYRTAESTVTPYVRVPMEVPANVKVFSTGTDGKKRRIYGW